MFFMTLIVVAMLCLVATGPLFARLLQQIRDGKTGYAGSTFSQIAIMFYLVVWCVLGAFADTFLH